MADEMLARSLRTFTMDLKLTVRALLKEGRCDRPRGMRFLAALLEDAAEHVPQQSRFSKVLPLACHSEAEGRDDPDHFAKLVGWAVEDWQQAQRSRQYAGRTKPRTDFRRFDWRLQILSAAQWFHMIHPWVQAPPPAADEMALERPYFVLCDIAFAIATGLAHFRRKSVADVQVLQHHALVDIFGVRYAVEPAVLAWNDATVPKLAQGIHDDRAWDRMPILADACEDAGVADANLLGHLRCPAWGQKHWRGCHALEALRRRL